MSADGDRSVHPFFRQSNGSHDQPSSHYQVDGDPEDDGLQMDQLDSASEEKAKTKRSRRTKAQLEEDRTGKKQRTLQDIINPNSRQQADIPDNVAEDIVDLVSSDPVVDTSRRKRRRITPAQSAQLRDEHEIANSTSDAPLLTSDIIDHATQARAPSSPRVIIPVSLRVAALPEVPVTTADDTTTTPQTPPRKTLTLNANGKFSSPVTKKPKAEDVSPAAPKRRGRPRKSKDNIAQKRRTVVLSYGSSAAGTGAKIDLILSGEERVVVETPRQPTPRKLRTPKKSNKPPHPFFAGKPKEQPKPIKLESPRKVSATTPGKLRRQIMADRPPEVNGEVPYAVESALLKDRLMIRHPGARDPPWPDRQQAHVRGLDDRDKAAYPGISNQLAGSQRKRKASQIPLKGNESVLRRFGAHLKPELECVRRADGLCEPRKALRRPDRSLITGHQIRQRVAHELAATMSEVDLAAGVLLQINHRDYTTHPGLRKFWSLIPTTLSAFDELRGENVGWAQKYAPETAEEVLQPSHEMRVLGDWLKSLRVSSVEHISTVSVKTGAKAEPKPRKKRRKHDDLDDFLVDDDEDVHDMDELTDPEDTNLIDSSKGPRSIVQSAAQGTKLSNAVLLSGPPGCGKTAAAYAVAKELGFKIFEISSSERRSGKDVLDKIGDMTENHLVRHHGVDPGELSSNEDNNKESLDEAFQRDLASGRQGKMATFFKPQAAVKKPAAPKQKAPPAKVKTLKAVEEALKKPPKDQQQSLILLEEVDILFKDDKEFWNTIFKLIVSSKRPFIMTCNDEDMVPLQAMNLHAILRFTQPPVDLAADYLLLLAAAEGHQLKRNAVTSLYEAKKRGLRASIVELDFWCQMAVGDPKGGLGWIYQRYPPGCDIDEHGRTLRVVSEGTYQQGMGLASEEGLSEDDQILFAWREHGVVPTSLLEPPIRSPDDDDIVGPSQRLDALERHARLAYAQSALDAFAGEAFLESPLLDTTTPQMPDKARHHYIEGLTLLQTDELTDHEDLSSQLVVASVRAIAHSFHANKSLQTSLAHAMSGSRGNASPPHLTRHDFAVFDTISTAPETSLSLGPSLTQSAFDGPTLIIATDLAPYVRSIVQFDLALEEQRERLNRIMTDGETRKAKRARTTRAARSALEGSQRASTRRERWFVKGLDLRAVLRTGGIGWPKTLLGVQTADTESMDGCEPPASSAEGA
ncbi:hypothetical protein LTR78_000546 [Recurvomyces mirabilis]|uniref:AAA+ ATPase domain-containing protein n=1 Tax=Recurvomyces mirabilis TaxID=574656 RepID=A0AAE0WY42_9PEZI|nr:hypothetical protein LTR78_000546 [Recurvomyces mirabilis]KAK5162200.1 hypothetical protein LTS14_000546 [Recurvomyces mirabilis]